MDLCIKINDNYNDTFFRHGEKEYRFDGEKIYIGSNTSNKIQEKIKNIDYIYFFVNPEGRESSTLAQEIFKCKFVDLIRKGTELFEEKKKFTPGYYDIDKYDSMYVVEDFNDVSHPDIANQEFKEKRTSKGERFDYEKYLEKGRAPFIYLYSDYEVD